MQMKLVKWISVVAAFSALPAWAVKPANWVHEQPKDFAVGKTENVVITSRGEVMLGRESSELFDAEGKAEVINALAQAADGTIYAASGPDGHIFRIRGDETDTFATLDEGNVFSLLLAADGTLLAGTGGGEQARIYAIDREGKSSVFFEPENAKYVWAMARGSDGTVYAATGTEGQIFVIDADGKNGKVLADLDPKNLLCMAFGDDGMIYVGTDEDGLIYRINPETGKPYVMYDAAEAEISAITVDAAGNIYAATAAADQARPGRSIADKPGGRPDDDESDDTDSSSDTQPAADGDSDEPGKSDASAKKAPSTYKIRVGQSIAARLASKASSRGSSSSSGSSGGGNAIYRIDTFGFVTEIFREPVIVLDLAESAGTIYATTGNEGRIYAITPGHDVTTNIAKLEPAQATSLLRLDDGRLIVGTANAAKVFRVSDDYAGKGTLVSKPLDAGQIVKWGRLEWGADVPTGTKLTVATRTGNVADEESDAWDEWSPEIDATSARQVSSPGARFLQYRLTFETNRTDATPSLTRLSIARVEENRPPLVSGLEVISAVDESENPGSNQKVKQAAASAKYGDEDAPAPHYHYVVKFKSEDPNQDTLLYEVYYRPVGHDKWVRLAKEIKEALHIWDSRTVPDGKYEVRVVADDRASNAEGTDLSDARISDPFVVDNTPPDVRVDRVESAGKSGVVLHCTATDQLSAITEAAYRVDSAEQGRTVGADDDVFDSREEAFTIRIRDLDPGDHWISIRVSDDQGNVRYLSQPVSAGE